jgi:ATP phosphoribosyltransferase regulatory subunit
VTRLWPVDGTIDRLPEEAAALRELEGRLAQTLASAGYREVVVPLLERDGVWSAADAVRFVDRHGELLGLRPDFTGPVARLVATRLDGVDDVKVAYRGTVFRDVDTTSGERRQRQQVGFERFARGDVAEDAEIVATARQALRDVGVDVTVGLGSAALVHALLPDAGPDVRQALDRRDVEGLPPALRPLLDLHGGLDVVDAARRALPAATHAALDALHALATRLAGRVGDGVVVDLAEVRPWSYYTGVVFALYADGAARAVAAGGRYDGLTGRFGRARPAVGATFDVDAILALTAARPPTRGTGTTATTTTTTTTTGAPLRVALPKGRIQKDVLARLGTRGPSVEALRTRSLVVDGQDGAWRFFLVKDPDVAAYVERGAADVGVAGLDVLREGQATGGGDVLEPLVCSFGGCRMCLCARPGFDPRASSLTRTLRIASKYPRLARAALAARGLPCEVIELKGSVELAVVADLADAIVDLVETGETLRQNGLVVIEELFSSTARAVVNRAAFRRRHDEVRAFLALLARTPGA